MTNPIAAILLWPTPRPVLIELLYSAAVNLLQTGSNAFDPQDLAEMCGTSERELAAWLADLPSQPESSGVPKNVTLDIFV